MSVATASKWVLDPAHTLVEFSVKHMMIATVKGRFSGVEGVITADPADLTGARFEGRVDVATVDTRDAQRDEHLRSADFFDAEKFPHMTFTSTRVERTNDGDYRVAGHLTIRGVTREVVFHTVFEGQGKDPWGNDRIGLSLETKISRKEFGLVWNVALEAGGVLVGDEVKISIALEAIKQA